MMFKILILRAWYNLSDEVLEKQFARDLAWRIKGASIKG
ncbi:MAG: transposase [Methylococcales symbiont of Iophon sp. n. MRB-2018]|nr:MAG: transposase [Methylococcales symbiont of Iophon sp. n. MRB-2018]KAF3978809.1 MAG: transposase [Methylococcales symbiont of Iophon sp. n. MRB-2018]